MRVYKVYPGGFGCNSYLVTADGKTAVVIDCASPSVYDSCIKRGLTPVAVLLTHGHFDHVGGCGKFYEKGVPIYCSETESGYIFSRENKTMFGGVYIPEFKIAGTFKDGEEKLFGGISFKVISTPGHTAGSVCFLADDCLFTGDTLFCESVGRCDLPTGSSLQLQQSLKKLFALDGDCKVYCGHEGDTTLEHERQYNPYA